VVLRYWEDRSVEEVADLLGLSTGTVKSPSARGLARLRQLLGEPSDDPPVGALTVRPAASSIGEPS
jgi:DNA-directed RNA polymerase specialized sigma24 family protein